MSPLLLVALLAATPPNPSSAVVAEVGDAYVRLAAAQDPMLSRTLDLPVKALPDLSLAREEGDALQASALLKRLGGVTESALTHEETLSLAILRRRLEAQVNGPRFHFLRFPVTPYASPLGPTAAYFSKLPLETKEQGDTYLRLLKTYPAFIRSIQETLEGGLSRGVVLSADELAIAIPFVEAYGAKTGGPFEPTPERLVKLGEKDALAFKEGLAEVLTGAVNPAVTRLSQFLSGPYKAKAPQAVGLSQYPGGAEYYAWLVRSHTTMDVTPQVVHERGLAEVARVELAMKKVRDELNFQGTAAEFREKLRHEPRLFPKTPEEIADRLMSHIRRIEPRIDEFFDRKPKAPYGVRRLPLELEAGETFGHYAPGLKGEAGYYFFNGSHLEDRSLLNAAPLIFHELVPGHHFQINLTSENDALPPFRRQLAFADTAYVEGWGEYSSILAGEMGMYVDPYDRYGRLAMDMFLSDRLVVDTGMNALGWSREKAVAFMRDHLMETDTQINSESLRYSCDIPGQALAYKMGGSRIVELREMAKSQLGPRFDIRHFHDAVLLPGSLPMSVLEGQIRWFVEQERSR